MNNRSPEVNENCPSHRDIRPSSLILISDQALAWLSAWSPPAIVWNKETQGERRGNAQINKPVVLRLWPYVNGLKEVPLHNLISAIFAET
jgi:hypothetical protein